MNKSGKFLFLLWMLLAVAAFVGAFFITAPVVKVISVVFGIMNIAIVLSWVSASIKLRRIYWGAGDVETIKNKDLEE